MYTLTRKLSVVCLTVVLSFLVYGCGGSSKQALITDVSTEMVTAGLKPDAGTYNIQPGGTATAGDVTFACPLEGSPCEVTVDDDGNIVMSPSAEGMATAMDSASAAARLEAVEEARLAEEARVAAVAAATASEEARVAAVAAATASEEARVAAVAAATASEEDKVAAVAAAMVAEEARVAAVAAAMVAEEARVAAVAAATASEEARVAAVAAATASEEERVAAVAAATASEEARVAAVAAATASEEARVAAVAAATASEEDKVAAVAAAMVAEEAKVAAVAAAMVAEGERDDAVAAARLAGIAKDVAEGERDAAVEAAMIAEVVRDDALEAARLAKLRANPNAVDTSTLLPNYMAIPADTYYIEPGGNENAGDANFACPANGEPCEVIVAEDGTVVSAGGMATVQNSMAAMTTRTAIALFAPGTDGTAAGALVTQTEAPDAPAMVTTVRSPEGVTTITLTHDATDENEVGYESETVKTSHEIPGWMGKTLTRDDSAEATMELDAVPATEMDEATVYTNIDPAMRGKVKYEGTGDGGIPAITVMRIEVEADEMYSSDDGDTFKGAFIRMDGTRIPGTFTCDADDGCADIEATETVVGTLVLSANPGTGWEFESNENVKEGETADANYMYFGYWLKSPVDSLLYEFATFSGGIPNFAIDPLLRDNSHALTATYEGGAAGMYVTRELRVKDGSVDQFSPGFHGRFTAKAILKAYFGEHADFAEDTDTDTPNRQNMVEGTITEVMSGDTELGFEVTLGLTAIGNTGGVADGVATATFGNPGDNIGTGDWDAQFYGANADTDATDRVKNRTLPSGVAGQFDVDSLYTKVVGAFAAEKQ